MSDDRHPRSVKLPFDFGDVVYHRAHKERLPGVVFGFFIAPGTVRIHVRWGDNLESWGEHFFCELSTEFVPSFE